MIIRIRCQCLSTLVLLGAIANPASAEELVADSAAAQSTIAEAAESRSQDLATDPDKRAREGTRVEKQIGWFKTTGDRLTFHVHNGPRYQGLENLALERIAKVVGDRHDHPEQLLWEVSGTLTEYRGVNYLLVSHAILKNKPHRAPPGVAKSDR